MNYAEDKLAKEIARLVDEVKECPICRSKDVTLQRKGLSNLLVERYEDILLGTCGRCQNGFKIRIVYTLTTTEER